MTEAAHKSYSLPAMLAIAGGAIVLIPSLLALVTALAGVALVIF